MGHQAALPASRARRYRLSLLGLALFLLLALLLGVALGSYAIPPLQIPALLFRGEGLEYQVLVGLRLPRVLGAALVGALLALAGGALQGLFRNPLVDPGLIGVSSGAALGAALFIVLAPPLGALEGYALPLFAFLGGLLATQLLWRLAQTPLGVQVAVLLLSGIALNALVGAFVGLLTFLASEQELRSLTFWTLGGFAALTWPFLLGSLPLALLALGLLLPTARGLNALVLGEREAFHLGVDLEALKRRLVAGSALAVGVAVALAGGIGFLGLLAPHLFRLLAGPDHRYLLPGAALLGAGLAVVADLLARTLAAPAEIPVGVLTALLGGPFFLYLVLRYKREVYRA
ncbi:MAG: iron ABC transporter permease [Thermus sp.]|uniref:FecCD family ABC transporter permease n=1 Tax=unclassified Thermus TaxID=2619321 RepID=UPI000238A11A|nr:MULTISPECIES: iron ABC transporter permease [unclassified Thermus]AEV16197.1 Hemin transport system permease protein hmuU [Thermus sp. CCB_US3_UF1]MCS6868101.1 iron ABC transporter permease [Thermus sp.]MCS7218499.1 iron ABC transporter permease [Thermus sp.]MCX7849923.1 iron ABC transporter permease [Thermus sp.]MDW8017976.1 iron ABC transporter permease [Thermus sp.]